MLFHVLLVDSGLLKIGKESHQNLQIFERTVLLH